MTSSAADSLAAGTDNKLAIIIRQSIINAWTRGKSHALSCRLFGHGLFNFGIVDFWKHKINSAKLDKGDVFHGVLFKRLEIKNQFESSQKKTKISMISLIAIFMLAVPAHAEELRPSKDFAAGWCAGDDAARKGMLENRNHWRQLLGLPQKSNEEVIKWIYSKPWVGSLAPRRIVQPEGAPQFGPPLIESVDLYVILPPTSALVYTNYGLIICENGIGTPGPAMEKTK